MTPAAKTVRVQGRRADAWTAKVVEWGETLPCVHQRLWTEGAYYHEPNWQADHPKSVRQVRLLRGKRRVILTTDKFTENGTPCGAYTRTGYVAIYAIGDVTVDERGLRFRFVRRLANAR